MSSQSFYKKGIDFSGEAAQGIRIARARTCYQMATLMGEKLVSLLNAQTVGTIQALPDTPPPPPISSLFR